MASVPDDNRVNEILKQLARYSDGDFTSCLKVSEESDDLNEISKAINTLGRKLSENTRNTKEKEERTNTLLDILIRYTVLDFSSKAEITEAGDEIDAIGAGLNALAEELNIHIAKLRDSEEQIKTIFENAPDAVFVTDSKGVILSWNPAAFRIFGWSEKEAIGKFLHDLLIPSRYRQEHVAGISHFLTKGEKSILNTTVESSALKKDDAEIQVEMSIAPAELKESYLFIYFLRDITERKKAEELITRLNNTLEKRVAERTAQLDLSEKKYRNLFENNPMPMWVLELPTLRFLDVNESAIFQYGYSREEFLSMTAFDIRPEEERQRFVGLNRLDNGPINRGLWKHLKKDGSLIFAEVFVHEIIFDEKPCRLILSVDVTERKAGEEALRNSEARFRRIFESKLIGFFFWDIQGTISDANDFFLEHIGYTRQELNEGKLNWFQITPPEYAALDQAVFQQVKQKGVSEPFEKEYIRKDGSRLPVLVGAAALNENNAEKGVAYIMDISQRKKMEEEILGLNKDLEQRIETRTEQLQIANKELEAFSYTVSHDLRAPLRAILGYSQMLMEDYGPKLDEEAIRLINTVKYNAKRMGQLVDDLLEFSRMGKKDLNETFSNLDSIVREAINELSQEDKARIRFILHPLGMAYADHSLMQNVFQNLISNAVKYSSKKENPEIEIGVKETNGAPTYFIRDNGAGFDMAYYNKLFGVFHRLHRQDEFQGTGVGLAIVQRIILRHGGKVWAEGKVNLGATFYFTLDNSTNPEKTDQI